jgi:hypothetical protein
MQQYQEIEHALLKKEKGQSMSLSLQNTPQLSRQIGLLGFY